MFAVNSRARGELVPIPLIKKFTDFGEVNKTLKWMARKFVIIQCRGAAEFIWHCGLLHTVLPNEHISGTAFS
jgi:hypothetical protein